MSLAENLTPEREQILAGPLGHSEAAAAIGRTGFDTSRDSVRRYRRRRNASGAPNVTDLLSKGAADAHEARRGQHRTGREFEWDGAVGWIKTEPLAERPKDWDAFLIDSGLDPETCEVIEPVQVRGWDTNAGNGDVVRMHYYRLAVRRRGTALHDIEELVRAAKSDRLKTAPASRGGEAFVLALGDLQLGKVDGDGVEGTVQRFIETTALAVERYLRLAKGQPVYLLHLGDCIEGMVSQDGRNTWRTSLTTTEQVRLYRRLLLEQVKAFSEVAPTVVMAGIPGNHDEAHRPLHTYGDSWAIEAVVAVSDALNFAGGYDHVSMVSPNRDELTLTLDVAGTIIGLAHGHQFGNGIDGWRKWWQGQQHGRQPIGDADLLLCGHFHHLKLEANCARSFLQVPALESESTWFRHTHGEGGNPGVVTFLAGAGSWSSLEVLSA